MSFYEQATSISAWIAVALSVAAILVAVRANKHSRRQAEAATTAERLAIEQEERQRIVLELVPRGEYEYELRNVGTHPAYDVEIECGDIDGKGKPKIEAFAPGDVERYFFVRAWESEDEKVTVTWRRDPDESGAPKGALESQQFLV